MNLANVEELRFELETFNDLTYHPNYQNGLKMKILYNALINQFNQLSIERQKFNIFFYGVRITNPILHFAEFNFKATLVDLHQKHPKRLINQINSVVQVNYEILSKEIVDPEFTILMPILYFNLQDITFKKIASSDQLNSFLDFLSILQHVRRLDLNLTDFDLKSKIKFYNRLSILPSLMDTLTILKLIDTQRPKPNFLTNFINLHQIETNLITRKMILPFIQKFDAPSSFDLILPEITFYIRKYDIDFYTLEFDNQIDQSFSEFLDTFTDQNSLDAVNEIMNVVLNHFKI